MVAHLLKRNSCETPDREKKPNLPDKSEEACINVHVSGCRNPVTLCSILSSLSPSLSRTFRDAGFFFRGIHVSEIHFRELSRKTCDTNSPFSAVKCALKPLIPSTTGIVLQQLSLWQHVD
jgi:hypothetical protein